MDPNSSCSSPDALPFDNSSGGSCSCGGGGNGGPQNYGVCIIDPPSGFPPPGTDVYYMGGNITWPGGRPGVVCPDNI
jgi:hypothetical protein